MQEKFTAFSWWHPQLAHRNCHHKIYSQYQNMNKPIHCHAHITMQHPGPYCVNIEHHQISHTSKYGHSINNIIDAVCTTSQDIHNLYNLTTSLATSINFNQMILPIRSVFANLWDSLHYLQTVSTHTMEYIDTTTSSILSPHVLPVTDLQNMLRHITDTLPPTLHLTISPEG